MKEKHISEIRKFNRFYTNIIGLLDMHILNSDYSLPEVRIMYELHHRKMLSASEIVSSLQMDKGYLSRILKNFEKRKLISKRRSTVDGRAALLCLTKIGEREFQLLNKASDKQIHSLLTNLSLKKCDQLIRNMREIKQLLSEK